LRYTTVIILLRAYKYKWNEMKCKDMKIAQLSPLHNRLEGV
jgi:hypothetical protein